MTPSQTRRKLLKGIGATGAVGLAGCAGNSSDSNQAKTSENNTPSQTKTESELTEVTHATEPKTAAILFNVIQDQELDRKYGIKINLKEFISPPKVQKQLVYNKDIPTAFMGPIVATRMYQKGKNPQLIGPYDKYFMYVLTRKDSDINKPEDLRGKKITWASTAADAWLKFVTILNKTHGVSPSDLKFVNAAPPASISLLEKGEVDAILQYEPLVSKALATHNFEVVFDPKTAWEEYSGLPLATVDLAWNKQWFTQNESAGIALGKCIRDSQDYVYNNFEQVIEKYGQELGLKSEKQLSVAKRRMKGNSFGITKDSEFWTKKLFESDKRITQMAYDLDLIGVEPTEEIYQVDIMQKITE